LKGPPHRRLPGLCYLSTSPPSRQLPCGLPALRSFMTGDCIMLTGYMIPLRPLAFRHGPCGFPAAGPGGLTCVHPCPILPWTWSRFGAYAHPVPTAFRFPRGGCRWSRYPAIPGPGPALEHPGFSHPFSASGTSACISPASTPGPSTLGIWLPFRAPQGRRYRRSAL
jgi:hypothetical protein